MLLTLVAAPLLAASAPVLPFVLGAPHRLRRHAVRLHLRARGLRRLIRNWAWPLAAVVLYAAVTWGWHLPGPYEAALRSDVAHALEHATLLAVAALLWWAIYESGRHSAFGYGAGIAAVFLTSLAHGGLGAVLTFAPHILYGQYAAAPGWGLAPLDDQHLAGVVMWAPSKLVHGAAVVVLAIAWLRAAEARARARNTPPVCHLSRRMRCDK